MSRFRNISASYLSSTWVPSVLFLGAWLAFMISAMSAWAVLRLSACGLLLMAGVAWLGILGAAAWNICNRQWRAGMVNLLMLPAALAIGFVSLGLAVAAPVFGPSEDGFADHLTIPKDLAIAEPESGSAHGPGAPEDGFQRRLLAVLQSRDNEDSSVTADVASLSTLHHEHPDILRRYLATSPAWRVFTEGGSVFATRRWMIGSRWRYTLHGYYTRHSIDPWSKSGVERFQSRVTIGLDGTSWNRARAGATHLTQGETKHLTLTAGNELRESDCVIAADGIAAEIFEQSEAPERPLTKAAIAFLRDEFRPLVTSPSWETAKAELPPGSIRHGPAALKLSKSFQPGIYDSEVWANPGEPGMIYLKAFEATHETALSASRLKDASNEWIGWSDDPKELFLSNTHFTIYEGDWGKPYAARFEVWFVPDGGGRERKLISKVFKIEGWQR